MAKPGRNDPCPCGSGKKYKHCHLGKPGDTWANQPAAPASPEPAYSADPYPATTDAGSQDLSGDALYGDDLYDYDDDFDEANIPKMTPLDNAWELIELAWDEAEAKEKRKLAKEALRLSADCAGAYYVLGQCEESAEAQIPLYDQAIAAAERVLSPRTLDLLVPYAWIDPEVEYAMYSMLNRAIALIDSGRNEEGIDQFKRLLELDPEDRVRARQQLILQLMTEKRLDEAIEVDWRGDMDPSDPTLAYTRALLRFLRDGDSIFAKRALAEAIMSYPENAAMLAESFEMAEAADGAPQVLSEEEARLEQFIHQDLGISDEVEDDLDGVVDMPDVTSTMLHHDLWHSTEGAGAWLRQMLLAGPQIRYQTGFEGNGPRLVLTEDKMSNYRHCPHCHRPTDFHPIDLVVMIDPDEVVDFEVNARRCSQCDIVCIATDDIARSGAKRHPQMAGRDFVPIGFIPSDEKRPGADGEWLREHMRRWRSFEDYDAERTEWPTLASQMAEIDDLLDQLGARHLLGPSGSPLFPNSG